MKSATSSEHTCFSDFLAPFKGKSASFWGFIMIAVGGLWLLLKMLPFILGFAIPALLIYAGYLLISRERRGSDAR